MPAAAFSYNLTSRLSMQLHSPIHRPASRRKLREIAGHIVPEGSKLTCYLRDRDQPGAVDGGLCIPEGIPFVNTFCSDLTNSASSQVCSQSSTHSILLTNSAASQVCSLSSRQSMLQCSALA